MVDSAELFEAIAHPARIRILKILEKQPSSFASLKRQLGIDSSGNLDFHIKKLGELVTVRADGLYGLTSAGKEALLSIDVVETWEQMERHKVKMFPKMPREALSLGLLEICTTVSILLFFVATPTQSPPSWSNLWGILFLGALLLTGFSSGSGIFVARVRSRWSWVMVMAKSALIISIILLLLNGLWKLEPSALCYLPIAGAEMVCVILALMHPVRDFLGIGKIKLSHLAAFGGVLCISSGVLLILLESAFPIKPPSGSVTVFTSISDTSILCGLLIMVGGVLILAGKSTLGAAISIIFGFFPPPLAPHETYHAYDLIKNQMTKLGLSFPYDILIAGLVGSLPIVGGLLALVSARRIRT